MLVRSRREGGTFGDTMIIIICNSWGTTFFGREWFRNDDQDQNEKNVHFYFAEQWI
jgi:hypothetical protein